MCQALRVLTWAAHDHGWTGISTQPIYPLHAQTGLRLHEPPIIEHTAHRVRLMIPSTPELPVLQISMTSCPVANKQSRNERHPQAAV